MDLMGEARQLTEPVEKSLDNMDHLGKVEEQQVDIATDMEDDEMRVEEVVVEEQRMSTQNAPEEKQRKSKQGETRKGGEVYEQGGEGMGSEYPPSEEVTLTTAPPSNSKPTKKLRMEREESPPERRKSRTRTRKTIAMTQ
jgi:hypothetical protein